MNKAIRITVLTGFIFFLASHYLVMSINKEYFPVFAYLYPFVAKVWFESGRLLLSMNWNVDLETLFKAIKYLFLLNIAIAIFAFKYQSFYRIILWIGAILFACYLLALLFLGLATIYPIYTVCIAFALAIFLFLIKNKPL
ncbi:hypothetical protein [Wohlfahrtiimonas populi]|uniref:hypothetical protein n=1 Tax=Wohlfahrtiimonas populi TaxID=1940240 RepID=UPI00098D6B62|nr:hypothetical protein [Wohlfahrtiimonas populi]